MSNVQSNVPVDITVPAAVRGAAAPPVRVEAQKLAEGVYYLTGGSHHSVAIDMGDHTVVVEAPLDEARSLAVIAKVKETIPGKPIRAVVNTHHHFDHAGGLRTFVDEGATIVTHQINQPYYVTAWAAPRTLRPDRLAKSGKAATFQTFTDKDVLKGANRTIEVHWIANSPHHDGFAMVYLPADKILIEADAYTPAAGRRGIAAIDNAIRDRSSIVPTGGQPDDRQSVRKHPPAAAGRRADRRAARAAHGDDGRFEEGCRPKRRIAPEDIRRVG